MYYYVKLVESNGYICKELLIPEIMNNFKEKDNRDLIKRFKHMHKDFEIKMKNVRERFIKKNIDGECNEISEFAGISNIVHGSTEETTQEYYLLKILNGLGYSSWKDTKTINTTIDMYDNMEKSGTIEWLKKNSKFICKSFSSRANIEKSLVKEDFGKFLRIYNNFIGAFYGIKIDYTNKAGKERIAIDWRINNNLIFNFGIEKIKYEFYTKLIFSHDDKDDMIINIKHKQNPKFDGTFKKEIIPTPKFIEYFGFELLKSNIAIQYIDNKMNPIKIIT
jgi:hypothetical protein